MVRAPGARRGAPRAAVSLALATALAAGGCGAEDEIADGTRDPAPITISAVISAGQITVSPARFGAGTIELLASNQTPVSQRLELRGGRLAGGGDALVQRTGPINPGGTASLKATLDEGSYVVSARSSRIEPATIAVGPRRGRARDRALQP